MSPFDPLKKRFAPRQATKSSLDFARTAVLEQGGRMPDGFLACDLFVLRQHLINLFRHHLQIAPLDHERRQES